MWPISHVQMQPSWLQPHPFHRTSKKELTNTAAARLSEASSILISMDRPIKRLFGSRGGRSMMLGLLGERNSLGREYISTAGDIGRKLPVLSFHENIPTSILPPLVDIPLPIIIDMPPGQYRVLKLLPIFQAAANAGKGVYLRPHACLERPRGPQRHSPRKSAAGGLRVPAGRTGRLGPCHARTQRHSARTALRGPDSQGSRPSPRTPVARGLARRRRLSPQPTTLCD